MSSETKRQLGIKTRAVKRLAADVRSYLSEKQQLVEKLEDMVEKKAESHEIKRQREFVEEAEATVQDVRQKLQENYTILENYLDDVEQAGDPEVLADTSFLDARKMLSEVAPLVSVKSEEQKSAGFKITIYGGSRVEPDDPLWRDAEQLGERLAEAGYHVITGGYGGTMEAVSLGASRIPNAKIEGVLCPAIFPMRTGGNRYLNIETKTNDLCDRVISLIKPADAFIVLPGNIGTLTELILTWNISSVETLSSKPPLTILLWREPWKEIVDYLGEKLHIPDSFLKILTYVETIDDVIDQLEIMRQHRVHSKQHMHLVGSTALVGSQGHATTLTVQDIEHARHLTYG